jgi:hypothetical protein
MTATETSESRRSRTSAHRRRTTTSTAIRAASPIAPTSAIRQAAGAQPRIVSTADPTSSSVFGAERATTADRPASKPAAATRTPSIVRRFRRPGSSCISSVRPQERPPSIAEDEVTRGPFHPPPGGVNRTPRRQSAVWAARLPKRILDP